LQEGLEQLKIADNEETNITDDSSATTLKTAIAKLDKATTLLFRILSVLGDEWHPDAKLPALTWDNLDETILNAEAAIQSLIDKNERTKTLAVEKKGVVHQLGKGIKNICVNVKPFLKTFLTVAVQGAAVIPPVLHRLF